MREGQTGFRRVRSCADQIVVLRNVIEQPVQRRKQVVVNFIESNKAFDSLHTPSMWNILRSYGVPIKIINVIKLFYESSTLFVRVGEETQRAWKLLVVSNRSMCCLLYYLLL